MPPASPRAIQASLRHQTTLMRMPSLLPMGAWTHTDTHRHTQTHTDTHTHTHTHTQTHTGTHTHAQHRCRLPPHGLWGQTHQISSASFVSQLHLNEQSSEPRISQPSPQQTPI